MNGAMNTAVADVPRVAIPRPVASNSLLLSREQRAAIFARGQADPLWWVKRVVGAKLWARQAQILESVRDNKRTAVRSCHSSGKTFLAALAALWWLYNHPRSIVVTTAPTDRQVRKIMWEEIRRAHVGARIPLGGTLLQTELRLDDGWFAFGFSTDDPNAFQGLHARDILVIFDEGSGVSPTIWDAADGILTSAHARFLVIGNPTDPQSRFREEFRNPLTKKIHISAFDTPNVQAGQEIIRDLVTCEWVEERKAAWGEESAMYQSRVLGEFPTQGADTVIALAWVEAAQIRELEPGEPNVLGVDVAYSGGDETVIAHRRGRVVRILDTFRNEDPMAVTGRVIQAMDTTKATLACVDCIGIGAGVVARLEELGKPVQGVNVAERAYDSERFANRRAELTWGLRERLREGDIDLDDDEELAIELTSVKLPPPNSRGQIVIESKPDMKLRGVHSPDRMDAVMLAFAADSEPRFDVRASFVVA
jgi:hypothetical protein